MSDSRADDAELTPPPGHYRPREGVLLPLLLPLASLAVIALVLLLFSRVLLRTTHTGATAVALVAAAGIVLGLVASILPARRAARMNVVRALSYE